MERADEVEVVQLSLEGKCGETVKEWKRWKKRQRNSEETYIAD